jgi:hypothetical protein
LWSDDVAFAVGLGRAMPSQRWAPRLIGVYGVSLVAAGIFRADPALGFPVGTAPDARDVSWHGLVHLACGAIGFGCLIVACLLLARRFATDGDRGWAWFTRVTGIIFLAAFVGIASGAGSTATTLGFVARGHPRVRLDVSGRHPPVPDCPLRREKCAT